VTTFNQRSYIQKASAEAPTRGAEMTMKGQDRQLG
jgi:hypothetical protein